MINKKKYSTRELSKQQFLHGMDQWTEHNKQKREHLNKFDFLGNFSSKFSIW